MSKNITSEMEEKLLSLQETVENAKLIPFTKNVAIDKDYISEICIRLLQIVPMVIDESSKIVEQHDRIVEEAKDNAEARIKDAEQKATRIIANAEKRAQELVLESSINNETIAKSDEYMRKITAAAENKLNNANAEAAKIIANANEYNEKTRQIAFSYLENVFNKIYGSYNDFCKEMTEIKNEAIKGKNLT